jgi:serine/threonine protein phosphatase 1
VSPVVSALRVLVLPDLHGRLDALEALLRATGFVDAKGKPRRSATRLVQLGDFLDRGPHPRACLNRLRDLHQAAPSRVQVLKGNHEDMALRAHGDPAAMRMWLLNGGGATLRDYERRPKLLEPGGADHRWMESLPSHLVLEHVLFCHAGLAKGSRGSLDEPGLLWARPPLERGPYRAVVCGHTPTPSGRIEVRDGVFCCDIGLGHGQEAGLECLALELGPERLDYEIVRA